MSATQTHRKNYNKQASLLEATESSRALLLVVFFFKGAAVMVTELIGAKIIAPFYGASLYVWAFVLGVILAALATGYGGLAFPKVSYRDTPLSCSGVGSTLRFTSPWGMAEKQNEIHEGRSTW